MTFTAKWICPPVPLGDAAPKYSLQFSCEKEIRSATLYITALGIYEARINRLPVSDYVLAPGWTVYTKRLQYQQYDVASLLSQENQMDVIVGKGWYHSPMPPKEWDLTQEDLDHFQNIIWKHPLGLLAQLEITYTDGTVQTVCSDENWTVSESPVRFAEIYNGEIYDATFVPESSCSATIFDGPSHALIPQEGPKIICQDSVGVMNTFVTHKGEVVFDFGQNLTGLVQLQLTANAGEQVSLSFAEVMDPEGNFYTANYRNAQCLYEYTCTDGFQTFTPVHTFYGFRYIRINKFPGGPSMAKPENFTTVVVCSELKQTGFISCSNPLMNQFFDNVLWGQRSNFLDVPTDCPQRDERLGWTGDALIFVRAACLNYDVEQFFRKWLADLAAQQRENGYVGHTIPDVIAASHASAAWGDVAIFAPWELYLAYGDKSILKNQFASMKKWLDYIAEDSNTPYLWIGGKHFGDWLALDADPSRHRGASDDDFVASAFYAQSTKLVIQTGEILGEDVSEYRKLYSAIIKAFQKRFSVYRTQTECVLAAHFGLAPDPAAAVAQLVDMLHRNNDHLQTGFVGTPYLLHVLSDYGYTDLAYTLMLHKDYPSWLYQVTKGATTVWEHWNGIREDGTFWDVQMNSFNHYAYGSVMDWVYSVCAGIQNRCADDAGYRRATIAPIPDARLDWMNASLDTRHGTIISNWKKEDGHWRFEITTPVAATIRIADKEYQVAPGKYIYYSPIC